VTAADLTSIHVVGPYFEDLAPGLEFESPAVTLTDGHAALYQAITGDRLRLPLDHRLSRAVTGSHAALAHPLLAINLAIGMSTEVSQQVRANLFYRGLVLRRPVHIGDTLQTTTRVVGLRQNRPQPDRPATGLAVLEIVTRNQDDSEVLHFWRCPMLPCRARDADTQKRDDLDRIGMRPAERELDAAIPAAWRPAEIGPRWTGRKAADIVPGLHFRIESRDTITSAPELVRMTLNMAMAHTDARLSYLGQRLVYGGHVISVAFAQVTRALPNLLTMLGWESCDHTAPTIEGDRIRSEVSVLEMRASERGTVLKLHVKSHAAPAGGDEEKQVLDWKVWVLSL
jgi:acyl dehydratase